MHGVDEPRLHAMHVVYYGIYLPDDSVLSIGEPGLHGLHDMCCGIYVREHAVYSSRG